VIDSPTLNTALILFLIVITLSLAIVDFALGVAMLTMMRGLHIVYTSLMVEGKELKNAIQFLILEYQRKSG
jgi:hypothetical protein